MAEGEIAYAAGLFEGEGTVYLATGGTRPYPHAAIRMTDREPLERMQAIFGGALYGPHANGSGCKPAYVWAIWGWDAVENLHAEIGGWLSPRRRVQFAAVLADAPPAERRVQGWHRRLQTHCKRGHEFTPENTGYQAGGRQRFCRVCRRYVDRRRAATAA